MKTNVIREEQNSFLKRKELLIEVESDSVPSISELIEKLGYDKDLTVIKKINTNFGRQKFPVELVIYDSAEAKESIEVIPQKVRKKMEAERKEAEAKAKKEAEEKKKAEEEAKAAAEEAAKAESEKPSEENTEETKPEEDKKE